MRILITGGEGQLGRALRYALSRGGNEAGRVPESCRGAEVSVFDLPQGDILDLSALRAALVGGMDLVIHCAAYTDVDGCEENPDLAFRVNGLGARNVALAAGEAGARLVHVSTDYVFSGEAESPYSEWDLCDPRSAYGASKRLGEQYAAAFCPRHFIARVAWLYGYEGKNFVRTILRLAREKKEIRVVSDQIGCPTSAEDLAIQLLEMGTTEEYGIYHCTGSGQCSWFEFAREIVALSGEDCQVLPCRSADYPQKARRPAYSVLEHRMLRATIGDRARPWRQAIQGFMAHYDRENGEVKR